jgi:hypothetical protein
MLPDEAVLESHDAFIGRLRREHPRKVGFWSVNRLGNGTPDRHAKGTPVRGLWR